MIITERYVILGLRDENEDAVDLEMAERIEHVDLIAAITHLLRIWPDEMILLEALTNKDRKMHWMDDGAFRIWAVDK